LKPEEVDAIADGRIFSGKQAKELRLVDELGGIELAVQAAAKLGKIEGDPKVVYPSKPRGNPLIELLSEGDDEDAEGRSTGFASSVRGSGDLLSLLRGVAGQVARETQEPGIYWLWKAH
jgi:ClpP class serine protease